MGMEAADGVSAGKRGRVGGWHEASVVVCFRAVSSGVADLQVLSDTHQHDMSLRKKALLSFYVQYDKLSSNSGE